MNQLSSVATIKYYDDHAADYISDTAELGMEPLYNPFLELIPEGGAILDAGCGSGRDSKAFIDRGYQVTAIDASAKMVGAAKELTGLAVKQMHFAEIDWKGQFDGIWACASLVHVPLLELGDVFSRLAVSLRSNGVCYMSFKEGAGERTQGDRGFTDFTSAALRERLERTKVFKVEAIWMSEDVRPGRETECWVNALARRN